MQIILAHPSWPWQDEAISLAMHKPNVWIDLSGWSPKYFPPQLVQYANTLLKDRMLFGSDFPLITPDRWLKDFAEAGFKDEVRPLILKENAKRLLGPRLTRAAGRRIQNSSSARYSLMFSAKSVSSFFSARALSKASLSGNPIASSRWSPNSSATVVHASSSCR